MWTLARWRRFHRNRRFRARVKGLDDVFAAGDATAFPIKQGGLAAQQADAAAATIASELDDTIRPQPFQPILRGLLLTGGATRYLRAELAGQGGESTVSTRALWWPPNRLCGRYLAPFLSSQVGFAADVMSEDDASVVSGTPHPKNGHQAVLRDLPAR